MQPKLSGNSAVTRLDLLTVLVCWNLAVAHPLFEVLSDGVEFFVFRRVTAIELILLVFVISLILPAIPIMAIYALKKISPTLGKVTFFSTLTVLLALIVLPLYRDSRWIPLLIVGCTIACAGGVSAGYLRFKNLRTFFLFLTPAILLIPILFLVNPHVKKILQFDDPVLPHFKIHSQVPIVFIIFDEFPLVSLLNEEGLIDAKMYPNFAKFVNQSDWYRNATTSATKTAVAVPGILTGSKPDPSLLPTVREYPRNLFTLFSESHDIQAIEEVSLSPRKISSESSSENFFEHFRFLLLDAGIIYLNIISPAEWRVVLPAVSGSWGNFIQQAARAKQGSFDKTRDEIFQFFLDSIIPSDKPGLFFLHSQLPHSPWQYLPSGKEYSAAALDGMFVRSERWTQEESASLCAHQRHILQVAYTDQLVGKLIKKLNDLGTFDKTLIVITSDHGASFRPGDARRFITPTNYADIICVPMIIKRPGQKTGRILDWNVQTTDIVPTIAEILNFEMPWNVTGVSVLNHRPGSRTKIKILNAHKKAESEFNSVEDAKIEAVRFRVNRLGQGLPFALPATDFTEHWMGNNLSEAKSNQSGKKVNLNNPEGYLNVDLSSNYIPVFVSGKIYSPDQTTVQQKVGIGVNGIIRAVTKTFQLNNSYHAFGALIPEDSLVQGKNDIKIFLLTETEADLVPFAN
jgi:hypothetical protein